MGVNVANIELGFHGNPPPGGSVDLIFRYHWGDKGIDEKIIVQQPHADNLVAAAKQGGPTGRAAFASAASLGIPRWSTMTTDEKAVTWLVARQWSV